MNQQSPCQDKNQNDSHQSPTVPARPCPDVLSIRKSCTADGVGLSHYILVENPKK